MGLCRRQHKTLFVVAARADFANGVHEKAGFAHSEIRLCDKGGVWYSVAKWRNNTPYRAAKGI